MASWWFKGIQTMFEKGLLAGKRILVTGGGSGLGAARGHRFVELGAELIICGRRLELLEATAARMRSELGGKVGVISCDIRDGAAVEAMMEAIRREAPIDVLVNNAAATFIAQSEHLSFRAADAILAPTLHGTMYCTLAAGRRWIEGQHKGVVLSILSTSTITGRAFTVPSSMAKTAVLAITKSLAVEWGPKGSGQASARPGPRAECRLTAFPKRHFPAIHRHRWTGTAGPSSSHNDAGTSRRAANTDIAGCGYAGVRDDFPCACASQKGRGQ